MGDKVTKVVGVGLTAVSVASIAFSGGLSAPLLGALGANFTGVTAGMGLLTGASTTLSSFLSPGMPDSTLSVDASNLSIQTDPLVSRKILFGQAATAGTMRFKAVQPTADDAPDRLFTVLVLAGYPVTSLDNIEFNGETINPSTDLDSNGKVTTGTFKDKLWFEFHDGTTTGHKFSTLIGSHVSEWNNNSRRFVGSPVVGIRADVDEDFGGKFEPLFTMTGKSWFDPRSGTDDWNDDSTWTGPSNNPALAILSYLRGFFVGASDTQIAGYGISSSDYNSSDFVEAANDCEQQVDVVGGGTINRYECNGFLDPDKSHRENLRALLSSMAGDLWGADQDWRIFAGVAQVKAEDFTESDIMGAPESIRYTKTQDELVKEIRGAFANASNSFRLEEYPPLESGLTVGEQENLDLPFTTDHRTAQRIRKIALNRQNANKSWSATYSHKAIRVTGGEIVSQDYSRYSFSTQRMRVQEWNLQAMPAGEGGIALGASMNLVEDDTTWYDWDHTTEEVSLGASATLPTIGLNPKANMIGGATQTFRQATAPSGPKIGWLWADTSSTPIIVKRWDGSAWQEVGTLDARWSGVFDDDGNRPENNAQVGRGVAGQNVNERNDYPALSGTDKRVGVRIDKANNRVIVGFLNADDTTSAVYFVAELEVFGASITGKTNGDATGDWNLTGQGNAQFDDISNVTISGQVVTFDEGHGGGGDIATINLDAIDDKTTFRLTITTYDDGNISSWNVSLGDSIVGGTNPSIPYEVWFAALDTKEKDVLLTINAPDEPDAEQTTGKSITALVDRVLSNMADDANYAKTVANAVDASGNVDLSKSGVVNKLAEHLVYALGETLEELKPGDPLSTAGDNLIANSDFERGDTNWHKRSGGGTFSVVTDAANARFGEKYAELLGGDDTWIQTDQYIPVDPQKSYLVEAWYEQSVDPSTGGHAVYVGVENFDINKSAVGHAGTGLTNSYCAAAGLDTEVDYGIMYSAGVISGPNTTSSKKNQRFASDGVRFVRPLVSGNYNGGDGTLRVHKMRMTELTRDKIFDWSGDKLITPVNHLSQADAPRFGVGVRDGGDYLVKALLYNVEGDMYRASFAGATRELPQTGDDSEGWVYLRFDSVPEGPQDLRFWTTNNNRAFVVRRVIIARIPEHGSYDAKLLGNGVLEADAEQTTGKPITLLTDRTLANIANTANFKKLETGTLSERPAAGEVNRYFLATDGGANGNAVLYRDTGSAWVTASAASLADLLDAVADNIGETTARKWLKHFDGNERAIIDFTSAHPNKGDLAEKNQADTPDLVAKSVSATFFTQVLSTEDLSSAWTQNSWFEITGLASSFTSSGEADAELLWNVMIVLIMHINDDDSFILDYQLERDGSIMTTVFNIYEMGNTQWSTNPTETSATITVSRLIPATGANNTYRHYLRARANGVSGKYTEPEDADVGTASNALVFQRTGI